MALTPETTSMAVFCDFENVALGVRDAKYERFDIKRVLERLLLKGSIVVKKAYCDWERYKPFKGTMHEASFELIEIPHVRQSGKNSADIRMVVDALDLCYTKSHVNTFVIISGDSDFSPLVSKLRENAKQVIGVGVKQSTSDLLVANCDDFIFYDDLVRDSQRAAAKRQAAEQPAAHAPAKRTPEDERRKRQASEEAEARKRKAIDLAVETLEALVAERGDSGKIWPSMVKQALKRRKPDFNESYFGFRNFGALLEDAQARGLVELGRDDKANVYVMRGSAPLLRGEPAHATPAPAPFERAAAPVADEEHAPRFEPEAEAGPAAEGIATSQAAEAAEAAGQRPEAATPVAAEAVAHEVESGPAPAPPVPRPTRGGRGRGGRGRAGSTAAATSAEPPVADSAAVAVPAPPSPPPAPLDAPQPAPAEAAPAHAAPGDPAPADAAAPAPRPRKTPRPRRPRKSAESEGG